MDWKSEGPTFCLNDGDANFRASSKAPRFKALIWENILFWRLSLVLFAQLDLSSTTEVELLELTDSCVVSLGVVVWFGAFEQLLETMRARAATAMRKRSEARCRCSYLRDIAATGTTRYRGSLSKW
tara:strand:- start:376 stop:753 length:378 start_codon:yes stop_codon:yes gene_type:complete